MNTDPRFSSDELLEVLSLSANATAIYRTKDIIIQWANKAMLDLWGKDSSITGLPLEVGVPELASQQFIAILKRVWTSGKTYQAVDTAADIEIGGELKTSYFDFEYRALKDDAGKTYAILHTATDVTERYLSRQALISAERLEAALTREQGANEELASTIEELRATNDQLNFTQEKLQQLNIELEDRVARRTKALAESEANFRNMISQAPVAIGLFSGHNMVLDMVNGKFLELWSKDDSVLGMPLGDILPEMQEQPYIKIMQEVYATDVPYHGTQERAWLRRNGGLEERYFTFINHPFKDADGKTTGVIVVASDVTAQVDAANKARHHQKRLGDMVMNTPISMAIFEGRDLVITVANQSVLDIWSRTREEVMGKKLLDVFPELLDQPFPDMLYEVFDTGKRLALPEIEVDINTAEGNKHLYVNFSYDPLFAENGEVESIMVSVFDVSEVVEARKQIEKSEAELQAINEELQALNEEVSASNEELAATNEELYATNEELGETQLDLQKSIIDLELSEGKLRYMLADAPIAIALLTGRDMIVESANKMVLAAWGKDDSVIGLPLRVAVPELEGQQFLPLLDQVFATGEAYYGDEVKALLEQNGKIEEVYSNFVYHPLKDNKGQTTSIVLVANVVTEQVLARKEVQKAEEQTRFAIEAANVGTWFLNTDTHEFNVSPRLKEQFGFYADEDVTFDMVAETIADGYQEKVRSEIAQTIATGRDYIMEHPLIGHHDQKKRWVRAYGKMYPDDNGKPVHFSGLIIDITEQKEDEMRKNDFIGMVSHELKTPLTSLSAYAQMLYAKARNNDDAFTTSALEKVNTQVKKMSTMINGFLNVSRLESGKIFLSKQEFSLDDLISEMIGDARLTVASHVVTFSHSEPITVDADRDKIGSVISNLLSNAVKYSPKGKNIDVECRLVDNMAQVSVKDQGMGVKPQDIEKIFDRYYRVESSHMLTVSGFGIGLYLCAEIVQRHDGRIWVESGNGEGSTFYFTLPVN
ncbi:PAS domain-containing protein [Mucilaginibacter pedocola]|uniref:histidine kinase n=1 Tax=Mucilaginibacter pedocola TaxID=1792845 RepID=A0A1S9PCD3_9SPHI|nr:PAS domain-containing protein [Mucilaginibacter pedocola]OOQ58633.1 hypothetical protein BC343_08180 [Mucilaginibacter pedocola]